MSSVENGKHVGLILTIYDDMPEVKDAYYSLRDTFQTYPYMLIGVDAGSTDGTLDFCKEVGLPVLGPHRHLSEALNKGIDTCLEFDEIGYVGWVHPDMLFPQKDWLKVLIEILADTTIGKLGPDNWGTNHEEREGNTCPWVIPVEVLCKLKCQDGFYFDERYIYCGGWEDFDLNRRVINNRRSVRITSRSKVKHEGMISRKKPREGVRDYHNAGRINAGFYLEKWGDNKAPV